MFPQVSLQSGAAGQGGITGGSGHFGITMLHTCFGNKVNSL
jgi:hypothetical protein